MTSHVELTDPRALLAYAHPIRLSLLGLLRRDGPQTATEAAAKIGESVASCSFHLRQLARYGLVEEAGGGTGRAKPWRATARFTSWSSDSDEPELASAATMLDRVILDRYHADARAWLDHRGQESAAWRRAGDFSDYLVYLTAAETRRLTERMEALVQEFEGRADDPAARPKGSRAVRLIHLTFPYLSSPVDTPAANDHDGADGPEQAS